MLLNNNVFFRYLLTYLLIFCAVCKTVNATVGDQTGRQIVVVESSVSQHGLQNYYEKLGVQIGVSQCELEKAYRKLALEWHPDNYTDKDTKKQVEGTMQQIAEAYNVLKDSKKRKKYDAKLLIELVNKLPSMHKSGKFIDKEGRMTYLHALFELEPSGQPIIGLINIASQPSHPLCKSTAVLLNKTINTTYQEKTLLYRAIENKKPYFIHHLLKIKQIDVNITGPNGKAPIELFLAIDDQDWQKALNDLNTEQRERMRKNLIVAFIDKRLHVRHFIHPDIAPIILVNGIVQVTNNVVSSLLGMLLCSLVKRAAARLKKQYLYTFKKEDKKKASKTQ